MVSQYSNPINVNQIQLHQMSELSTLSDISPGFSISSSPSTVRSVQQKQPTAPLDNQFSLLSEIFSHISISSSPSIIPSIQQQPTAPSETLLKNINNNKKFENNGIESKQYHHFRDDI